MKGFLYIITQKSYIRCFVAGFLTLIVLWASSAVWLSGDITVSFNSKSTKDIDYQVFYTDKKGQSFNATQSQKMKVKAGAQNVSFILPIEKLVLFRLDFGNFPQEVTISNLTIKGVKSIKPDYNDFNFNQINKYNISNDGLTIVSNQQDPYIFYKNPLNLRSDIKPDVLVLLVLLIFSFMFFYKTIQYLAEYKVKSLALGTDIVFLVGFFLILIFPMIHISDSVSSATENRVLASKPRFLFIDHKINTQYGLLFEKWYNDHFMGRRKIVYLYNYLKHLIPAQVSNNRAMVGKEGWLYSYGSVNVYRNANLFTDKELETIGKNMDSFVKAAQDEGVDNVYFMLSNDKESLYPEYYPDYILKSGKISRLEQLVNYIKQNYPDIKLLNFKDELEKIKKKEQLFYKTGTHMNNIGAFYEYKFIMEEIRKDYPDIDVLGLKDYDISVSDSIKQPQIDLDIYNSFMVLPKYSKSNFKNKILKLKSSDFKVKNQERPFGVFQTAINDNTNNKLHILIVGDSFSGRYFFSMAATFAYVTRILYGNGVDFIFTDDEKKYIKENVPDIIMVETTERFLQRFLTLKYPN